MTASRFTRTCAGLFTGLLGPLATLFGILVVAFTLMHLSPGDPAALAGATSRGATPEATAALKTLYGLDRPLPEQWVRFFGRALRLDFGDSVVDGRRVSAKIFERVPLTIGLMLVGTALSYFVGLLIGIGWSLARSRSTRRVVSLGLALLYSLPTMALGLLLVQFGAPIGGLRALLPAASCLAAAHLVKVARQQESALHSALTSDYLQTARMKGASPTWTLVHHALPNSLLPILTLLSGELPMLLSGSVIVEQLFALPGIGQLGFDAVLQRDYPVLLGLSAVSAVLTLLGVRLAELLYAAVDPRLRRV